MSKHHSFQDSRINNLRCLRKSLLPHILRSFWNLNDFVINFFAKPLGLFTFPWLAFSRNSAIFFLFSLNSVEWKRGIRGNVWIFSKSQIFLSNWKMRHYTDFLTFRVDSTKIFFCKNKTVVKIPALSNFNIGGNYFSSYLARFLKLNNFIMDFFPKEVALVTFFSPQMTFSRNSADFTFSSWLFSPEQNRGICGFQFQRYLSNLKIWVYTDFSKFRMDTTNMFFYNNKNVSKIPAWRIFNARGKLFFLIF